jgi:hypothetical protein
MTDVNMSLRAGATEDSKGFSPTAGGAIEVGFKPGKATVSVDYSKEDSVIFKVDGEFSLKDAGANLPALTFGAGGSIALDGKERINGSVAWEISKNIEARAQVGFGREVSSVKGTLTIRF